MSLLGTAGWGNFLISKLARMTWGVLRAGSARTNNDILIPRRETVSIMARKISALVYELKRAYRTLFASHSDEPRNQGSKIKILVNPGPRTSAH